MEVASSLIGLGISFVPVPGLKPAFDILKYIWDSVQKASYNRKALANLAVSAADILTAVNHVLSHTQSSENVLSMLRNLEKVLEDIRDFAEKHVSMNLFQTLIKNIDVEGKVEFFQNRLQVLSMAFNIAAYGAIESQLQNIMNQRSLMSRGHPASSSNSQDSKQISSKHQVAVHATLGPVRVEASFNEPCTMEVRKRVPYLLCAYFADLNLTRHWGLRVSGSKFESGTNNFDIVRLHDSRTWTWTLAWKIISASVRDPAHPGNRDMIDIVFPDTAAAAAWFSWLHAYASPSLTAPLPPSSCSVNVRKKYDAWMKKTPAMIERRRHSDNYWLVVSDGKGKNPRAYATYFTYVSDDRLPYNTVYRSGDTLVVERSVRIQDKPIVTRRYRFDNEETALIWFDAWRGLVTANGSKKGKV